MRALAALSVFFGHTVTYTYSLAQHRDLFLAAAQLADEGVAIFFLISGFLLYRPFLAARRTGRRYGVGSYARRRILRIVPAYWVALSILLLAGLVSGVTSRNWWIFYGFGQIYSFSTIGQGIGVAWTLCVEVTFYIALPFLALAAGRLGRGRSSVRGDLALLVCLSLASLAFRAHFNSSADFVKVSTLPGTFVWFALGMGLAVLSVTEEARVESSALGRLVARRPTSLWIAGAAGSALVYYLFQLRSTSTLRLIEHVLYALVALLVLLPGVLGESGEGAPRRLLRYPALAWIGLISYSFYLYHPIVLQELNKLVADLSGAPRYLFVLVVGAVVTCACAAASYYLVERPMLRIGRGGTSTRPRKPAPRGAQEPKPGAEPIPGSHTGPLLNERPRHLDRR